MPKMLTIKKKPDGDVVIRTYPIEGMDRDQYYGQLTNAATLTLVSSVIEQRKGMLESLAILLGAFRQAEDALYEFFADGENLSDEDLDAISEVIRDDPS